MITPYQMVLEWGINYMINLIRCDVYLSYTHNLFPCQPRSINYFPIIQSHYMLFCLQDLRIASIAKAVSKTLTTPLSLFAPSAPQCTVFTASTYARSLSLCAELQSRPTPSLHIPEEPQNAGHRIYSQNYKIALMARLQDNRC